MRFTHRHSFFPLVVIGLTLVLGALIVRTTSLPTTSASVAEVPTVVDEASYRAGIQSIVRDYQTSSDAVSALQSLLDLRVPAVYKQLHLDLAIFFANAQADTVDAAALTTIAEAYPWIYDSD